MIRYTLICAEAHEFDGWFRNGDDFDRQKKRGIVACPICNSTKVEKALMAPAVAPSDKQAPAPQAAMPAPLPAAPDQAQFAAAPREAALRAALKKVHDLVTANAEYVGKRFPEEARRIHYEEAEARGIYGEASREEAERMVEEGIEFYPLPVLPEDQN